MGVAHVLWWQEAISGGIEVPSLKVVIMALFEESTDQRERRMFLEPLM